MEPKDPVRIRARLLTSVATTAGSTPWVELASTVKLWTGTLVVLSAASVVQALYRPTSDPSHSAANFGPADWLVSTWTRLAKPGGLVLPGAAMTSRERVLRTLEFRQPDRPPRDLWLLPVARLNNGDAAINDFQQRWPTDITQCSKGRPKARRATGDPYRPGTATDEWGCVFENVVAGVHGEVKHPLLDDYANLPAIQPPVEFLELDVAAINAFCRQTDLFVFASGWARPYERMQFLRGTENLMMDIAEDSAEFRALLDLVHGFFRRQYELWAQTEVDALVMMDDWGSQNALLISPATWRRVFKPLYAEYTGIAHAAGKKFFMHSDGYIADIYADLIEIGVDAINSQLFCMDMEAIGRQCRGQITFWGEIDRQHILPHGTTDEVRAAVRRVKDNLWQDGGCIAQFSFEGETRLPNADAVFDEWQRLFPARGAGA